MSNDKLAEALRAFPEDPNPFTYRRCYAKAQEALQAHAAEASHTRIPDLTDDEWMILFHARPDLKDRLNAIFDKTAYLSRYRSQCKTSTEAAQTQTAEPVGEVVGVTGSYGEMRMIRWRGRYSPEVGTKLYTRPQTAQDAALYQELLMAVEKKFPGESRHETALRYIRETELQSCEPKCDAAMAKESGNG